MKLSNKTYDLLKWVALVALPALTAFYGVVGAACNIPATSTVLTIAVAFDTMLGAMLGLSTSKYVPEVQEGTTDVTLTVGNKEIASTVTDDTKQ